MKLLQNIIIVILLTITSLSFNALATFDVGLKGFDDSILYSIVWPGAEIKQDPHQQYQELVIQTDKKEKYQCLIPHVVEKEKDSGEKYNGPNALDLLSDLFNQPSCSYRLEPYWTYELCHGKYIRQYHEEREGKKAKLQEFYLGRWDKINQHKLREVLELEDQTKLANPIPVKKIDGLNMPYVQLNMSDGTQCDLSSKPRQTKVLYVCYTLGKHEIYSIKETSICEYEVIVLSPLLCKHPRYRPQESGENSIKCIPIQNPGTKPESLLKVEAESLKLRTKKVNRVTLACDILMGYFPIGIMPAPIVGLQTVVNMAASGPVQEKCPKGPTQAMYRVQDGTPRVRVEMLSPNGITREELSEEKAAALLKVPLLGSATVPVKANDYNKFVTGRDCVQGTKGDGWWKYEYCYGKSVTQFHVEKDGTKTTINLGNFIKSNHLKWLAANPHKRPVVGSHVNYLYTMGTNCAATGLPRETEVKLKCDPYRNNVNTVSIFLLEPRTCYYVLGVESHVICNMLNSIDEDGLLLHDDVIGFSKADPRNDYQPIMETPADKEENREKREEGARVTVIVLDANDDDDDDDDGHDNLNNHIPDGDE